MSGSKKVVKSALFREQLKYLVEPSFGRPAKLGQRYSQYKGCLLNNQIPSPPAQLLIKRTRLSATPCTMDWSLHNTVEDRLRALVPDKSCVQAYKVVLQLPTSRLDSSGSSSTC